MCCLSLGEPGVWREHVSLEYHVWTDVSSSTENTRLPEGVASKQRSQKWCWEMARCGWSGGGFLKLGPSVHVWLFSVTKRDMFMWKQNQYESEIWWVLHSFHPTSGVGQIPMFLHFWTNRFFPRGPLNPCPLYQSWCFLVTGGVSDLDLAFNQKFLRQLG